MPRYFAVRINKFTPRVRRSAEQALRDAAAHIENVSNTRVPTDKGDLKESSKVSQSGLRTAVSYSDEAAPIQHERMDYRHDDGTAKFLEKTFNSERTIVARAIAEHLRRTIGG